MQGRGKEDMYTLEFIYEVNRVKMYPKPQTCLEEKGAVEVLVTEE